MTVYEKYNSLKRIKILSVVILGLCLSATIYLFPYHVAKTVKYFIIFKFFYNEPISDISAGLIILIAFLLILALSESFDNFSIGKVISLSREVKKKEEVDIKEYKKVERTPLEEEAYQKLKRKVIKLYPYALLAKQIHETSKENMNSLSSKREKRKYRKTKEKELRDRFEDELKALYRSDGPVLVKLIHRETGNTTYQLLRESKSWIKCMVYQMAAKNNGYSLKATYDREKDRDIENIVEILKSEGQLPVYVPL